MDEQVSLRDHLERMMEDYDRRYQQRFESQERAVTEYRSTSETRFQGMNEFRGALADAQSKYVTRTEALALVLAACSITGVIIEVLNLFMHKP